MGCADKNRKEQQMRIGGGGYPLLLTGTIAPKPFSGNEEALNRRICSYESSIERYICDTVFNPIVFAENSEYHFDAEKYVEMARHHGKTFEFIKGTLCADEVQKHGKGYGDGLLIQEALAKSECLRDVEFFYKMTGRVFLKNSGAILKTCGKHKNEFISYDGMGWVMTYLFKANRQDYLNVMRDVYLQCDDKSLRDMEICFWLRLYASDLDIGCFETYPVIEGNMGDTNTPYTKGCLDTLLRTIGAKLGIFSMKSKTGKIFWRMYQTITARKPYVSTLDIK